MKTGCIFFLLSFFSVAIYAQAGPQIKPFLKSTEKISKIEDSLKKQFENQKLVYPPQAMYLRSFKYDRQLEVWVKSNNKESYKLLKSYKVCQQSGTTGPKRVEGDFQVPEGFYYINEFNPNSNYHLSLGLNYPNASDRILSDVNRPGSAIYVHGNCVSTGCIPITDVPMEELYFLANVVKNNGQEFIPIHIFPIKYNVAKSKEYLENTMKDNISLQNFNKNIKSVYDFFETKKELPIIMVNSKGEYLLN
ncbi:MAG: L,D-transpeptidase family protein [Ferruginibacter sp.]|nr:L,D-transpeptidase family protein [Ferruginibacter sp.]